MTELRLERDLTAAPESVWAAFTTAEGEFVTIDAPNRLVQTWQWEGEPSYLSQ